MAFFASILQGGWLVMLDDSDTFPVCVCHCQSILNLKKKFMKLEERHKKSLLGFFSMKTAWFDNVLKENYQFNHSVIED